MELDILPVPPWVLRWAAQPVYSPPAPRSQPRVGGTPAEIRARAYLKRCDPCVSGRGGSLQAYKIACRLTKGFHLSVEASYALLLEDYNARCEPPWSEKEWLHHLTRAEANGTSPDLLSEENPHATPQQNGFHANAQHERNPPPAPTPEPTPKATSKKNEPSLKVRCLENVEMKDIEWIWENWLPLGKLVVLDGDPGLGKSTMLIDLAARISSDNLMPDGKVGMLGQVLILSGEDDDADTIKPRLAAAGGVNAHIHSLSEVGDDQGGRPLCLPGDLKMLEAFLDQGHEPPFRLVIIDPLFAFLSGVDASNDQDVRRALLQLRHFAEKKRVTILCLRHLNKSGGAKAIYRGGGSIGITGGSRIALLVGKHPDNDTLRVLAAQKTNLGPSPMSLQWKLAPTADGKVCTIQWLGPCIFTADDLLQEDTQKRQTQDERSNVEDARQFLAHALAAGSLAIETCRKEAQKIGIGPHTLRRAARTLCLRTIYHDPMQGGKNSWALPEGNSNDETAETTSERCGGEKA